MAESNTKDKNKYENFACCLGDAISQISTPVTVGLYARFGCRVNKLLKEMEGHMKKRSDEVEQKATEGSGTESPKAACRQPKGLGFINLLFRFLCMTPRLTRDHEKCKNVRFIFVEFSAWQFAGSDMVWAGLITTLCDRVKDDFGKVPLSVVRAMGEKVKDKTEDREWDWKTLLRIPIWILFIPLVLLIIAMIFGLIIGGLLISDTNNYFITGFEALGAGVLGCSTLVLIKNMLMVSKNMAFSQTDTVKSLMNKTDFSSQLGFMSEVKREVEVLTNFIRYMEIFERRKIRIVLKIVNLDRCTPDKVVGVLDAINILLSDPKAPFISILAVDPAIIVSCVQQSAKLKGVADNGYVYLNRIITLPFCIPDMDPETKTCTLKSIIELKKSQWLSCCGACPEDTAKGTKANFPGSSSERVPLFGVTVGNKCYNIQVHISNAYEQLENLKQFIEGNYLEMRRIVNTIEVMIRLMVASKEPEMTTILGKIVPWVILTSHWPTRFSWIWQYLDDMQQLETRCYNCTNWKNDSATLLSNYVDSYDEFQLLQEKIDMFLELDGDPDLFHKLLNDQGFTIGEAKVLLPYTINVPYSLKREMELFRGKGSLKRQTNKNNKFKQFTELQVLRMNAEDISKEMRNLHFDQCYSDAINCKKLDGRNIIYSNNNEIRELLGMHSLRDWANFKYFFLQARQQPSDSMFFQWRHSQGNGESGQLSTGGASAKAQTKRIK